MVCEYDLRLYYSVPSPRNPRPLSPAKQAATVERRRTLLDPDPVDEELTWEVENADKSIVISGTKVMRRSIGGKDLDSGFPLDAPPLPSGVPSTTNISSTNVPVELADTATSPLSSTVPRLKKMPDAVAALHRLAIPFLKEMDAVVFNNRLGSVHLPDLEPAPSGFSKRRRKDQTGVIYGLSTRGEYNDGLGSYFELEWSNRLAKTAGRASYRQ